MSQLLQDLQKQAISKKVPEFRVGNTVKVNQKIKEGNKERMQAFQGLVLKMNSGHGADKTFTVRKIVEGVGVEKVFPLYSPLIQIEVIKEAKIRRAKLYYMRDRSGKSARLKETFVGKGTPVVEEEEEKAPEVVEDLEAPEEVVAEETTTEETAEVAEAPVEEAKEEEKA